MDLRRVKAFIAVADASSVTKAAARLHISQPPLSRQIHQLEQELGVTLFIRHSHGVTLTEAGERLLEKARALDRAEQEFAEAALRARHVDDLSETIRVGIAWGLWDLLNSVRVEFTARCPQAAISVIDTPCWYDSDAQLRRRAIDVALVRPPFDPAFAASEPIRVERIQAIVAEHSPLAAQSSISLRDLAHEPLLLWDRAIAPVLYDQILSLYAEAGVSPTMIPTPGAGPYNPAGMLLVASGRGVYLGYGVSRTGPDSPCGVTQRPVSDEGATVEVRAVYRKEDVTPTLRLFLDGVRVATLEPQVAHLPDRADAARVRSLH